MRDYGHGPDDTGDKLMRSLPHSQKRGRPAHLPLFAAITNDPFRAEPVSHQISQCLETVYPVNLFSFFIGTTLIANPHFVNPPTLGPRDFCTDFYLASKI